MLNFLKSVFCWWHNSTIGTQWDTFLHGKKIGEDKNGNKYVIFDVLYDYPQWKASDIDNLKDQLMDAVNEFTK